MSLMTTMYRMTCTLQQQAFAPAGDGSFPPSGAPTVLAKAVRCQIEQRSSTEKQYVGGRTQLGKFTWFGEYRPGVEVGTVVTDVARIIKPTDFEVDTFTDFKGVQQQVHRQYKVVSVYDPNGLHDHLELGLDVIEARPMP